MSGKAYTMREMKAIVEYLTEHRAFSEIKGRKMWMDYANSNLTTRTWQSLKETFLKRILPDITNPYYKLTVQQIASFRQGCDLERKLNNKLEIQNVDEESNGNSARDKDPDPSNTNNDEAIEAGEGPQAKKVERNRSSLDTIVIEPCYNTAEDIRKDLESPNKQNQDGEPSYKPSQTKSIRDYITYSEPLTPMLQEVLHDFQSEDEEDGEPQMQIVEYAEPNNEKHDSPPIEILDSENNDGDNEEKQTLENSMNVDPSNDREHNNQNNVNKPDVLEDNAEKECIGISSNSERNSNFSNEDVPNVAQNGIVQGEIEENKQLPKKSQQEDTENQSVSGTDSILPNNQEAFTELCNAKSASNQLHEQPSISQNNLRKRSCSNEIHSDSQAEIGNNKKLCSNKNTKLSSSDIERKSQNRENVTVTANRGVKKNRTKLHKQGNIPSEDQNNIQNANDVNTLNTENAENLKGHIEELPSNTENLNELVDHRQGDIEKRVDVKITPLPNEEQDATNFNEDAARSKSKKQKEFSDHYIQDVVNEVLILKSHSDSTSDPILNTSKKKRSVLHAEHKINRDKALANVFGFSGGITSRKKHMKHRKRLPSHHTINTSDSDEWTSDTESEYISPPRGRKNRQTRKYLKPKSARIVSLEEEGGLFVMYGKKIYPLVKDGKIVKSYTTFSPSKDTDNEESFWRLKYVEEKKKTEELTKLLKGQTSGELKSPDILSENKVQARTSIIAEKSPTPVPTCAHLQENIVQSKEIVQRQPIYKDAEKMKEDGGETKTVKIKYSKNNEEVQLEGHWMHIHPVLEQLVHILHKDPEPAKEKPVMMEQEGKKLPAQKQDLDNVATVTRDSTPASLVLLDDDVKEKVSKIEEDIFKEIEERDKADSTLDISGNKNVTQRKGTRTRKSTSVAEKNPAKKPKMSNDNKIPDEPNEVTEQPQKQNEVTQQPQKQNDVTQQPQKQNDVTQQPPETEINNKVVTRRRTWTAKKTVIEKGSKEKNVSDNKRVTRKSLQDAQVKYNFRATPATSKNTKTNTKQKPKKRYPDRIFSSPDAISNNSIESSLGYQDSDASNQSHCFRKKRRQSYSVLNKGRAKNKRASNKKHQIHADEYSSDSNASFVTAPLKSNHQSSSSNSEIYRTESYQLLFPQGKNIFSQLEKIDESPNFNKTYCVNNNNNCDDPCDDLHIEKSSINSNENFIPSPSLVIDGESSSHITLPPSPVLSIVENISISKKELNSTNDVPIDISVEDVKQTMLNQYMNSDVDMSIPLMEQNCGLYKSGQNEQECHYNIKAPQTQKMSDSLISKINAVNIEAPTLSDSLHQKLKNLFLESAKKLANQITIKSDTKVIENNMDVDDPEKQIKIKKKRCSTPRKRQNKRRSRDSNDNQELLVAQEHTEMCGSKKSYPPPLLVVTDALQHTNVVATDNKNETKTSNGDKTKTKKKKDIIKVKIVKPKKQNKGHVSDDTLKKSKSSLQTDSGINDTESGVFLQGCEDTVDLIHNHSDTCLHANECIGDSVEVIEENAMSIVSLISNTLPLNELKTSRSFSNINDDNFLLDVLCEDAQDAINLLTANKNQSMNEDAITHNSSDANISSVNSLMTDDLSNDPPIADKVQKRVSKWYLLSEDETTNHLDTVPQLPNSNSGWGANLQQIFPITCAVPDLSTITEENTPKHSNGENI